MLNLFKPDTIHTLAELKNIVSQHILNISQIVSLQTKQHGILRFEFKCDLINPFTWLHNQKSLPKFYWAERNQNFIMAGVGIADEIVADDFSSIQNIFTLMQDNLSDENSYQRYYGGVAFQPRIHSREWQAYHTIYFAIPQFEILHVNDEKIFALNIALKDLTPEYIQLTYKKFLEINFDTHTSYRAIPKIRSRTDIPDQKKWTQIFDELKGKDGCLKYEKIVLARKSSFNFDIPIKPEALLKHLALLTPNCYHFNLQIDKFRGFIGATPEQLFSLKNKQLTTEAIAGTTGRGNTTTLDDNMGAELLICQKNAQEHRFVVEEIKKSLIPLCESLEHDNKLKLLKLHNNQHLLTRFSGTIKDGVNAADILKALHPTPAVGGVPRKGILDAIRTIEPFDRGWYAAPIGYVGRNESEFAVAIRSALVENENLSLYAGAGVVNGSTSESEWAEIETKIGNFLKVFQP